MSENAGISVGGGLLGESIVPTCRYGHGPLLGIEQLQGQRIAFGLIAQKLDVIEENPSFTSGLRWFMCTRCGYSEFFDANPGETLAHTKAPE